MLSYERLQLIKQKLYEQKQVDVISLSNLLSVSETTVRRDLEKLQQQGFLTKTYGGAVLNSEVLPKSYTDVLEDENYKSKIYIANIASKLIIDGDAIFLSGSISQLIATQLDSFNELTVVTNDIAIANTLYLNTKIRLIVIGGQTSAFSSLLTGELAGICADSLFVNKAFIDVHGVDIKNGLTTSYIELAIFYKRILSITNEVVVLAEHTRFNQLSLSRIGPITAAHCIVTNQEVDDEYKRFCYEHNIKFYTSFKL